jgi:hypothetical protein
MHAKAEFALLRRAYAEGHDGVYRWPEVLNAFRKVFREAPFDEPVLQLARNIILSDKVGRKLKWEPYPGRDELIQPGETPEESLAHMAFRALHYEGSIYGKHK